MRLVLVATAACLLMSCGGAREEPQVGRASGIPVAFGDADPLRMKSHGHVRDPRQVS